MKVGMVSMKGNFNASIGQGVQKYIYNIWNSVNKQLSASGGTADRLEIGLDGGAMIRKASFTLMVGLRSFGGYDMLHMPAPIMYNPRRPRKGGLATTLHEFCLVKEDSPIYVKPTGPKNLHDVFSGYIGRKIQEQVLSSDLILPNSSQTMQEAITLGCDKRKLHTVSHAIDQKFVDQHKKAKKSSGTFKVGYIGSMSPRKNTRFAIDAFGQIDDKRTVFDVWGKIDGSYADSMKDAEKDSRVSLKGFAPEEKVVEIMDDFDVFVFPSLYEGFGLEILEAQARGLPVVICKRAQIPDEVRKHCLEAEDGAHMAQMILEIKENGYKEGLRSKAMAYAKEFTWERCARETIAAYGRFAAR